MEKLPKRFKEKWVKALRSGKYKQGNYKLYNKAQDNFCCIGVAEVICGNELFNIDRRSVLNKKESKLPKQFYNKDDNDVSIMTNNLINFNDSGKSFKWIASYIERYL